MLDTFNAQQEEEDAQQEEEDAQQEGEDEAGEGDLIVSASISDTSLTTGQAFTLTATVQNQGTDESPDLVLSYYRSSNATISTLDAPVGTDAVGRLAASEIRNESISLMAPSRPDTYYYGACVDSVSSESDTPINCSTGVRVIVAEDEDDAQDDHTPDESDTSTDSIQDDDALVAEDEDDAQDDHTPDESDTSTDSIQDDDALSSPPPTWVFAGDVPDADRAALREEMEAVRSWSADQYGVAATGFTVLVGADSEALAPVFQDVVFPGPVPYSPIGIQVLPADNGSAVLLINLEVEGLTGREAFSQAKSSILHEYFHVLQGQLASGFAQLLDGKIAYKANMGPFWLVEGLAQYADYAYSQLRLDRRPFLDRKTPYEDIASFLLRQDESLNPGDELMKLEDMGTFQDFGSGGLYYNYGMAFAASYLLVEQAEQDSYVQYWKLLHDRPTWQQAFEESFGIGIEDFYEVFEEWLPSQVPSYVEFFAYLDWPGKEALSRDALNRLLWNLSVNPERTGPSPGDIRWGGERIVYTAGASWTGYLSLSWYSDSCTHLLGWYKDGELTDQRAEATLVEFTGISSSLEWTLPARPDMLPRLNTLGDCGP